MGGGSKSEQQQISWYRPTMSYMPLQSQEEAARIMGEYFLMPSSINIAYGGSQYPMPTRGPMYGAQVAQQLYSPQPAGSYGTMTSQTGPTFMGCSTEQCFSFMEIEGGILNEIRRFRDEEFPKGCIVGSGYSKMSRFIVPLMRKHKWVKFIFRWTMAKPLIAFTKWYYKKNHYGIVFYPLAWMWKEVWLTIGKYSKAKEYTWAEFYDIVHSS